MKENTTANWKKDFPTEDLTELVLEGYLKIQKLTIAENWKETQFKLMHRAYSTQLYERNDQEGPNPSKNINGGTQMASKENEPIPQNSKGPSQSRKGAECPKCKLKQPTLVHLLWECPPIQAYWCDIQTLITSKPMELSPQKCILNILPDYNNKGWEQLTMLTARRCIARHWIHQEPPTVKEVEKDLHKLFRLERMESEQNLSSQTQGVAKYLKRWGLYIDKNLPAQTKEWITNAIWDTNPPRNIKPPMEYNIP